MVGFVPSILSADFTRICRRAGLTRFWGSERAVPFLHRVSHEKIGRGQRAQKFPFSVHS